MKPEVISAFQQFLRIFILGEIAVFLTVLGVIAGGINTELGTFMIEWNVAGAVAVVETIAAFKIATASAIDKFIHKSGVSTPLDFKGLDGLK